jgi:hypothetical protein
LSHGGERWNAYTPEHQGVLDDALSELSEGIDALIEEVKSQWIHIKDIDHRKGMFDFDYSAAQFHVVARSLVHTATASDFISAAFSELAARTDANLDRIRERLTSELFRRCITLLSAANVKVSGVPEVRSDFADAVAQCRTDLHNELGTIAAWFRRVDDRFMHDYEFDALVQTVVAVVSGSTAVAGLQPQLGIHIPGLCKGTTFAPMFDVLYILLHNAHRHGKGSPVPVQVKAWVQSDNVLLEVSNDIPDGVDALDLGKRLRHMADQARADSAGGLIRSEGGTGLFKLHKIIRHDLHCDTYTVEWTVGAGRRFVASVTMRQDRVRV